MTGKREHRNLTQCCSRPACTQLEQALVGRLLSTFPLGWQRQGVGAASLHWGARSCRGLAVWWVGRVPARRASRLRSTLRPRCLSQLVQPVPFSAGRAPPRARVASSSRSQERKVLRSTRRPRSGNTCCVTGKREHRNLTRCCSRPACAQLKQALVGRLLSSSPLGWQRQGVGAASSHWGSQSHRGSAGWWVGRVVARRASRLRSTLRPPCLSQLVQPVPFSAGRAPQRARAASSPRTQENRAFRSTQRPRSGSTCCVTGN